MYLQYPRHSVRGYGGWPITDAVKIILYLHETQICTVGARVRGIEISFQTFYCRKCFFNRSFLRTRNPISEGANVVIAETPFS